MLNAIIDLHEVHELHSPGPGGQDRKEAVIYVVIYFHERSVVLRSETSPGEAAQTYVSAPVSFILYNISSWRQFQKIVGKIPFFNVVYRIYRFCHCISSDFPEMSVCVPLGGTAPETCPFLTLNCSVGKRVSQPSVKHSS